MPLPTTQDRKRELRARIKRARAAVPAEERVRIDDAIQRRVCSLSEFRQAEVVLTYLAFGPEVQTRGIIRAAWAAGKVVALPWCVPHTREMRWFRVTDLDDLVRGPLGVQEPRPLKENEQRADIGAPVVAIVPGLTFDASGYRLGYGGGYYDVFLSGFRGASVGLCREAQRSDSLVRQGVVDARDLPVQMVVTEAATYPGVG